MNKILIVEDDKDMCNIIADILKMEGYTVERVYEAESAMSKLKKKHITS